MRILIDEDTAIQLVAPLQHLLRGHHVQHVSTIGWKGKKDRLMLRDAKQAGYDVIITRDRNQLNDPAECVAIRKSGLHHVRYAQRQEGMHGLALALGAVIAAMPKVMDELAQADGQRLVRIVGLEPSRRYELTDPSKKAPTYWPR